MTTSRGRILVAVLALAALAAISAIGAVAAQGATQGRVRIIHASPDAPAVDIFVDGTKAVSPLAFPQSTPYVALPSGSHNVKVFPSPSDGTGAPVLEADLQVDAGKDYTVLAVGRLGDATLALLPLEDNNASPVAGKAHVRLVHASPDAPPVDVTVAGAATKLFAGIAFKGVGTYTPVAAATYTLEARVASSGDIVKTATLALADRTVYTVVAVGLAAGGNLQLVPLVDAAAPSPSVPAAGTGLEPAGSNHAALFMGAGVVVALLAAGALGMAYAYGGRRQR